MKRCTGAVQHADRQAVCRGAVLKFAGKGVETVASVIRICQDAAQTRTVEIHYTGIAAIQPPGNRKIAPSDIHDTVHEGIQTLFEQAACNIERLTAGIECESFAVAAAYRHLGVAAGRDTVENRTAAHDDGAVIVAGKSELDRAAGEVEAAAVMGGQTMRNKPSAHVDDAGVVGIERAIEERSTGQEIEVRTAVMSVSVFTDDGVSGDRRIYRSVVKIEILTMRRYSGSAQETGSKERKGMAAFYQVQRVAPIS